MDAKASTFTGHGSQNVEAPNANHLGKMTIGNLVIEDSEVMLPPPPQPGGLIQLASKSEKHIFKAPPTPRTSELGLDRLALEKRKDRLLHAHGSDRENKRIRYDSGDDSNDSDGQELRFKGMPYIASMYPPFKIDTLSQVPSRPLASTNVRQRPEDTPSHGTGLSSSARSRLEEHRKARSTLLERNALATSRDERQRSDKNGNALQDFRDRLNRKQAYPNHRPLRPKDKGEGGSSDNSNNGRLDESRRDASIRSSRPQYDSTPSSAARLPSRSWDSTPSATERSSSRRVWDATPSRPQPRHRNGSTSVRGSSEWDTPRRISGTDYPEELPDLTPSVRGIGAQDWEDEQIRLDRDWYASEDGAAGESEFSNWDEDASNFEKQKEQELSQRLAKRTNVRQAQYNADNDLWETNRLAQSGIGPRRTLDLDFDDEEESKVHLLVHDLKPPFLDGRIAFTKQIEPVNPVKDPTSDLAIFSKKGSLLVRERREQRERAKAARKVAEIAGTALGNVTGAKEQVEADPIESVSAALNGTQSKGSETGSENRDHHSARKESQFASHLKNEKGSSQFSRSKTLKEQRQYLPAFACREQLMKAIRESQGEKRCIYI